MILTLLVDEHLLVCLLYLVLKVTLLVFKRQMPRNTNSSKKWLSNSKHKILEWELRNRLNMQCKRSILELKITTKKQMNSLATVEVTHIYFKIIPAHKVVKMTPKEVHILAAVRPQPIRNQQNLNSRDREKKIWRKSRCTTGPKYTKGTLMKCTKC